MTTPPGAPLGDRVSSRDVVMRGQAQDASAFTQIGTQVNVLAPAVPEVRHSLPPDTTAFTGRDEELNQITAALVGVMGAGGVVAVGAIDGMPGVGKTTLAVHAAHVLQEKFPDRQLFIDLHGHTPGREPVRPEDALAGLLTATGVDPRYLPSGLEGRVEMWRDRMAGRRALLVLDNAASSSQVGPLLPGGGDCLVLVTSRRHLGDLPGGVTPVLLDALPPQSALEMFIRLAPRAADRPREVAEVVRLAGFLPLAISLLARVFARHPSWTLANLAAETKAGLLQLAAEKDSVAAAFGVSYGRLNPAYQRLFRLLGLHPGSTIDAYAAAALAATSLAEAVSLLDGLHREGLVTETAYRRYGMHDLLRRYASDLAAEPADDSHQALSRLLDYYQHTAARAEARLARQAQPSRSLARVAVAPALDEIGQALAWVRADRASLLACLDRVTRTGQDDRVIAFTSALATPFQLDGPWVDAITRHEAAIQAARRAGDRLGEANTLNNLGTVRRLTGEYPAAARAYEQALGIYRDAGERLGEANALNNLGTVQRQTGDYPGAARAHEQALDIYRELGARLGEAYALSNLGIVRWQTGDYTGAVQALKHALSLYRDLGDRLGEASALNQLGVALRLTGEYPAAVRAHERALGICRDVGDRHGEANVLIDFGIVRQVTGNYPGAAHALEQAMCIHRDLSDRRGEANALNNLGIVRRLTGDYPSAVHAHEQALGMFRDLGDRRGQAYALTYLGTAQRVRCEYLAASGFLGQALDIYRDLGNRGGEAEALNEIGTLHRVSGDITRAERCHQQALGLARAVNSTWNEAQALAGLGRCALTNGHSSQAENLLRQAQTILQRIGAADAHTMVTELNELTSPGSSSAG